MDLTIAIIKLATALLALAKLVFEFVTTTRGTRKKKGPRR